MDTLENILNDEPIAEPVTEVAEPEVEAQPREPDGKFASKGETESASPAPVVEKPEFEHAAIIGERRRRQEAEARIQELEQQLSSPKAPPPSVFEDEEQAWAARGEQFITIAEQRALARFEERQIARSAQKARAKYADFDDAAATFSEMARSNPALEHQLREADNPGEFAYEQAKTYTELQKYGGDMNALVEARVREQLAATTPKAPVNLPNSLADDQSARSNSGQPYQPLSIEQILKR
jgi:hypothetical protein